MRFTKMQGLGNDYLYVFGEVPVNIAGLSKKLSDRHFGVGADGMIYISKSDVADFKMRIFNADGSEAKMCGNGIRCVGKYVYDKGYTNKTMLTIETLSGIRTLWLQIDNGKVKSVTVDMGKVEVKKTTAISVDSKKISLFPVSVGNPHAVIFVDDVQSVPITALGSKIEKHSAFPGGVNVEFVQALGENRLRMRVWERGSGITMACGTGACASACAAVAAKLCTPDEPVFVQLDGGILEIKVDKDNNVLMTGGAEIVFEGETIE